MFTQLKYRILSLFIYSWSHTDQFILLINIMHLLYWKEIIAGRPFDVALWSWGFISFRVKSVIPDNPVGNTFDKRENLLGYWKGILGILTKSRPIWPQILTLSWLWFELMPTICIYEDFTEVRRNKHAHKSTNLQSQQMEVLWIFCLASSVAHEFGCQRSVCLSLRLRLHFVCVPYPCEHGQQSSLDGRCCQGCRD